ncbi:MAG: hypothetical protein K2J74_07310 [Muribaculaceae bacterium]|nr:hypothetical protein [Muribaculaceae bacterium]
MKIIKTIIISLSIIGNATAAYPCTSAIISGSVSQTGRPILWKHRDTGEENNKVERIEATDSTMAYVALFNASDSLCREAWMGMNTAGFAIMNTASYNLKDDTVSVMDGEGLLMAEALGVCATVDDFERFLITHSKPLHVEANFGVLDANGNGAYFETDNNSFTRYNLSDSPTGVLIRTNYSHSGRKDEGYGYIREANAHHFIDAAAKNKTISPEFLTETVSRTFYHSVFGEDYTNSGAEWIIDQDFIPRRTSTATCAIEGGEIPVMWIGIGYPPASEIRAVTLTQPVPEELRGSLPNGHSPLCDKAVEVKHRAFKIKRGNGDKYIWLPVLYNNGGDGAAQEVKKKNAEYYKSTRKKLYSK